MPPGEAPPGSPADDLSSQLLDDPAYVLAVTDPVVDSLASDMVAAVESLADSGGAVGWTLIDSEDVELVGAADLSATGTAGTAFGASSAGDREVDPLTPEQMSELEEALDLIEIASGTTYYCGAGSYRFAYTQAFDDNWYALCRSGVGTHTISPSLRSDNPPTAVCPWNTRGNVYWWGGAYTPRWSTVRGPVSTKQQCYSFGNYQVYVSKIKILSCTGTCPV
jgi:hypothetical protein